MNPIVLTGFTGSNQALDPKDLTETTGVDVVDAEPTTYADLRPLKARSTVATVPTGSQQLTIWRMGQSVIDDAHYWLSWPTLVNPTLGFDYADTVERTYYTGDGTPKWTNTTIALAGGAPYPQASRELAVPIPADPPTVVLNTDGPVDGVLATQFYVYTYVNDIGWESGPSDPDGGTSFRPGANLTITFTDTPPSGNYGFVSRRLYRTQAEDQTGDADFFFVAEIALGTTSYTDAGATLDELLPTVGFIPPPTDGFGLIALWNDMMGMLSAKGLYLCEPGYPYAYPIENIKSLKNNPIATAKWRQNLLVLTDGAPVLFNGQDPSSMVDAPPGLAQACLSAAGVVGFEFGAVWPSSEGLAFYGDNGQALISQGLVTADQWKAMEPASMVAGRWQRFYVCSFTGSAPDGSSHAFMIDPLNPANGIWYLSTGFDACYYDQLADALYVLESGNVRKFASGDPMTAGFLSKRFLQPTPVAYARGKVTADAFPVTLTVSRFWKDRDGTQQSLVETRSVTNDRAFSLKKGSADEWQIEVESTSRITAIRLAEHAEQLKG